MAHRTMNHTKRRVCRSHKGNPKKKQHHKNFFIATPVKEIEWPDELFVEAPYAFDKLNRLYRIRHMKAVGLGASKMSNFDAANVPIFAMHNKYPDKE